jgi:signal transduction histidine kinase
MASLDRAIAFCNDTLRYGRAAEQPPRREAFRLLGLVEEVGDGLGLPREDTIGWEISVASDLVVDADREHLFRVMNNLVRNSVQALEANSGASPHRIRVVGNRADATVRITVEDTGPGVPPKTRERLFQAFQSSARRGGSGLGLAIAHELVAAHGGTLQLLDTSPGAAFEIVIPDRVRS